MADNETITDIIAEMRMFKCRNLETGELELCNAIGNHFADRLEAAHKRELSKICPKTGGDFGQLGDCAKMRKTLERIVAASIVAKNANAPEWILQRMADIFAMATTALAEPPRNCDIYLTEEAVDAATETVRDCAACSRIDMEAPCVSCMVRWLLAPATEKEGGAK